MEQHGDREVPAYKGDAVNGEEPCDRVSCLFLLSSFVSVSSFFCLLRFPTPSFSVSFGGWFPLEYAYL